jgi:hypothetical protein
MFNSPILDFSLSLIFLILLFSLLVSWIMGFIASRFNRKGRHLKKMLKIMLGGSEGVNWTSRLYNHPLIESLSVRYNRITSYIPEDTFAEVMTDLIVEEGREYTIKQDPETKKYTYREKRGSLDEDLAKGLRNMPESDLKRTLQMYYDQSGGEPATFSEALRRWYAEYMKRVNHTYGRRLRVPLIILGIITALMFNIDMFHISKRLWTDANLRENVVIAAESFRQGTNNIDSLELRRELFRDYKNSLDLPVGWGEVVRSSGKEHHEYSSKNVFQRARMVFDTYAEERSLWWQLFVKLTGIILSGFIVSFGAPFWFDLLKKITRIRKTSKA